jgi:hypothetical protein
MQSQNSAVPCPKRWCSTLARSALTHKNQIKLKKIAEDKHSPLICYPKILNICLTLRYFG